MTAPLTKALVALWDGRETPLFNGPAADLAKLTPADFEPKGLWIRDRDDAGAPEDNADG